MTSEIEKISSSICTWAQSHSAHVYGQNLTFPSYISGLGKSCSLFTEQKSNVQVKYSIFNTTNSELTSVGYGIGRLLCNQYSMLIIKQQDFLYLALDQLVNTVCNLGHQQIPNGLFKIICLISDTGTEGTQAWSNNLSVFESLPSLARTRYCFSSDSFSYTLENSISSIEILFLSTDYTYKNPIFTGYLSPLMDSPDLYLGSCCNYERIFVIVGFVRSQFISQIIANNCLVAISNINDTNLIKRLADFIKSKSECVEVMVLEDSSSPLAIANNIGYVLIQRYGVKVPVICMNLRNIKSDGFALHAQSFIRKIT